MNLMITIHSNVMGRAGFVAASGLADFVGVSGGMMMVMVMVMVMAMVMAMAMAMHRRSALQSLGPPH